MILYLCIMTYKEKQQRARLKELCETDVYPWFINIGQLYRKKFGLPVCFCDFYDDPRDKEVVETIALVIPQNNREQYMIELRNILGKHPWEMVKDRSFMHIKDIKRVLGNNAINGPLLFNILDWIWETCVERRATIEYAFLGEMGYIGKRYASPLSDVITFTNLHTQMEMMLVKMVTDGMWDYIERDELPCPLIPGIKKVLSIFYPIRNKVTSDNIFDVIDFIGFECRNDALYSVLAYQKLMKEYPKDVALFEKRSRRWFYKSLMARHLKILIPTNCLE